MPFPFLAGALSFLTSPLASTVMSAYAASRSAKAGQTDLTKLRNEANRAGFNPLTVLRATGGQGFNNTGGLSSAAFIGAFSRLGDNIAQAKQSKATLENTLANTMYTGALTRQAMVPQRSKHDIPILVTAYDPTGNIEDFLTVNPELLEMSASEFATSIAVQATAYASQHSMPVEQAIEMFKKAAANRKRNNAAAHGSMNTGYGIGPLSSITTTNLPSRGKSYWRQVMDGDIFRQNMGWSKPVLQQN